MPIVKPMSISNRPDLRVAAEGTGGRLHIESGSVDVTGSMSIPNTGGWQVWTTISTTVTLAAGPQVLRLVVDADTNGIVGNVKWIELAVK